jgi:hypothetical protein
LWNDQVKIVEDEVIKVGDAVQIFGGFSKDNIYGEVEISVGKFGGLRKVEDDYNLAPSIDSIQRNLIPENRRMKISDLVPGTSEIKGTVVQVFKGKFLFDSDSGEKGMVISAIVDDGTGDIRTVMFRDVAEKATGLSVKDLEPLNPDERLELVKSKLMGKDLLISGKVKNNTFFQKLEIVADYIKDLNAIEESKRIAEEIEAKLGG